MIYEDLKDKRILVTGSSSGIGAATAAMFAQQGAFVGVHYFRTQAGGEKTLAAVKKHSDGCLLRADIRDEYTVDVGKGLVFSVGPDGEAYTDDDIKLRIDPVVLGLK